MPCTSWPYTFNQSGLGPSSSCLLSVAWYMIILEKHSNTFLIKNDRVLNISNVLLIMYNVLLFPLGRTCKHLQPHNWFESLCHMAYFGLFIIYTADVIFTTRIYNTVWGLTLAQVNWVISHLVEDTQVSAGQEFQAIVNLELWSSQWCTQEQIMSALCQQGFCQNHWLCSQATLQGPRSDNKLYLGHICDLPAPTHHSFTPYSSFSPVLVYVDLMHIILTLHIHWQTNN